MAFNLKLVLKALLFSSSQPLSIKDVQAVLARFHEQAGRTAENVEIEVESPTAALPSPLTENLLNAESVLVGDEGAHVETPADTLAAAPHSTVIHDKDAELYRDVPSLITATQIREAMTVLAEEFRTEDEIFLLVESSTGYRLVTHPRFARWVRILRDEPAPLKLNQSALETLAIVAYRQPVTRTEIETIRGVSAEAGLNKLLERELVYITGRADLPGRPLQYGTTDRFMDFVGVKSLVELPASDVLSPRQIDEWLKNATSIKTPTDAEMGLPLEEGEGQTPNLESVEVEHSGHLATAISEASSEPSIAQPSPAISSSPIDDSTST